MQGVGDTSTLQPALFMLRTRFTKRDWGLIGGAQFLLQCGKNLITNLLKVVRFPLPAGLNRTGFAGGPNS